MTTVLSIECVKLNGQNSVSVQELELVFFYMHCVGCSFSTVCVQLTHIFSLMIKLGILLGTSNKFKVLDLTYIDI